MRGVPKIHGFVEAGHVERTVWTRKALLRLGRGATRLQEGSDGGFSSPGALLATRKVRVLKASKVFSSTTFFLVSKNADSAWP